MKSHQAGFKGPTSKGTGGRSGTRERMGEREKDGKEGQGREMKMVGERGVRGSGGEERRQKDRRGEDRRKGFHLWLRLWLRGAVV